MLEKLVKTIKNIMIYITRKEETNEKIKATCYNDNDWIGNQWL